jgi:hypothetical protein
MVRYLLTGIAMPEFKAGLSKSVSEHAFFPWMVTIILAAAGALVIWLIAR